MDATIGHTQRRGHRLALVVVALAAALLVGIAAGFGLRAWTSSSVAATAAPVTQAAAHAQTIAHPQGHRRAVAPPQLPDRSDVATGAQKQSLTYRGDVQVGGPH
ncbi:MAG TPA: hypothetical protein VI316_03700 [Candidatus Dormibacteraeota bacterium]